MALEDARNPMQGVSGPGPYAKRTDLQYSPDQYGAGVAMAQQKAGAPLAKTGGVKLSQAPSVPGGAPNAASTGTDLYAPTQRPNEPVTHGVDVGPGAGSSALMMQSKFATSKISDSLEKMLPYDTTGEIGILYQQAISRGM
jgi:hypothetical protein